VTIAGDGALENPDPGLLREARHYSGIAVESSVTEFTKRRRANLMTWRRLSASELQATSKHPNLGSMSVEVQLIHAYAHDGYHVQQLLDLLS
jgi:hypothetical protein